MGKSANEKDAAQREKRRAQLIKKTRVQLDATREELAHAKKRVETGRLIVGLSLRDALKKAGSALALPASHNGNAVLGKMYSRDGHLKESVVEWQAVRRHKIDRRTRDEREALRAQEQQVVQKKMERAKQSKGSSAAPGVDEEDTKRNRRKSKRHAAILLAGMGARPPLRREDAGQTSGDAGNPQSGVRK